MFRSQDMSLNKLMFAKESMWETLNYLAYTSKIMMHLPNKKTYKNENSLYGQKKIKRCEEILDMLKEIKENMIDFKWPISDLKKNDDYYIKNIDDFLKEKNKDGSKIFEDEENLIKHKFSIFKEHLNNYEIIINKRVSFLEKKQAMKIFHELIPMDANQDYNDAISQISEKKRMNKKFHSILGFVPTKNLFNLQKILFRISRENIVMKSKNLENVKDVLGSKIKVEEKTLIFILFPSSEKEVIIQKVGNVIKYYDFVKMEIPNNDELNEINLNLTNELEDNKMILSQTKNEINLILESFSETKNIPELSQIHYHYFIIKREQSFARNLIYIEEKDGFNQLLLWIPKNSKAEIQKNLEELKKDDQNFIQPKLEEISNPLKTPPTYFNLDSFTRPFQLIVNTYGVPRYKEANPGLFTIISFPFLFGIMYGDVGHGLIILLLGLFLCMRKNCNDVFNDYKYLVLLMGVFAFYCGWIYNEFFSIPIVSQKSCFNDDFQIKYEGCTYFFGIDWRWNQSVNEMSFINSFKMKFSIVIGVLQMLFGIFLKGMNGAFFGSKVDIFFEAIPQFVFMLLTFGYMSFCIVIKWLQNWEGRDPVSIIQLFINFFTVEQSLFLSPAIQQNMQITFAVLTIICMFLMLIPKPIILYYQQKSKNVEPRIKLSNLEKTSQINKSLVEASDDEDDNDNEITNLNNDNEITNEKNDKKITEEKNNIEKTENIHDHEESFGELFVHQMIETIEFVLGSISNTASYLRLWALSLAHGQLSKVFLDMIFGWTIRDSDSPIISAFIIIIGFVFFIFVTLAVILIMDTMECFLHALRLHWVEFQNKFFKGDGIEFKPFCHCPQEE